MPYRLALNGHKSMSVYRDMTKRQTFKITGNFSENVLFKIPVQPDILRNSEGFLFFLIAGSWTPHSNCNLVKDAFKENFLVKSKDFDFHPKIRAPSPFYDETLLQSSLLNGKATQIESFFL